MNKICCSSVNSRQHSGMLELWVLLTCYMVQKRYLESTSCRQLCRGMEIPSHWELYFSNKAKMSGLKEIILEGPELPSKTMHSLTPKRDGLFWYAAPHDFGPKIWPKRYSLYMGVYSNLTLLNLFDGPNFSVIITLFMRSTSKSAFLAHFCQKSGSSISISSSPLDDTKLAWEGIKKWKV